LIQLQHTASIQSSNDNISIPAGNGLLVPRKRSIKSSNQRALNGGCAMAEPPNEAAILMPSSTDEEPGDSDLDEDLGRTSNNEHQQLQQLQHHETPPPSLKHKVEFTPSHDDDGESSDSDSFQRNTIVQSEDEDDDRHAIYKTKYLVQSLDTHSFDSSSFHDSRSNKRDSTDLTTPLQQPLPAKTTVEIDTSVTPRAALSEAVMENMDFEILPDEDDDDDDDENDRDSEDEKSHSEVVRNLLHSVEEISLEDDDDDGEEDEENKSDADKPTIELSNSLSFESPPGQRLESSMSAPNSPTSARFVVDDPNLNEAASSPETSNNRRRIGGFFTASSPRRPGSSSLKGSKSGSIDSPIVASSSNDLIESTTSEDKASKRGQRLTTLIRTTMGAIKDGIKSETSSVTTSNMELIGDGSAAAATGAIDEQDSSSDESSYDEDEQWLEDGAQIFDDDIDQVVDCGSFLPLPNSFLNMPPDMYDYLDLDLVNNIGNQDISTFAWEHHLFVKGLLQLLFERDMIGVEDDIFDSSNITKMGVLRKKHAKSGWRVKYVEVRKGNLTYFADKQNEKRRTVHLRKRTCICRGDDLSFELIVDGGKRLLWMAKSEKECQGWIRAINSAMIGEMDDTRDSPFDVSTYQNAIDDFQAVQTSLKDVTTRQEYLVSINSLLYRQTSSSALRVPMKWIRENVISSPERRLEPSNAPDDIMNYTVRDFWESLCSTSIVINGHLVEANSTYSGERIIGALSRSILEFDKVEDAQGFDGAFNSLKRANQEADSFISEVEAVSYARSILSGALQSTTRGDMRAAVERLFLNASVACVRLESSEPLHIDVSFAGDDFSEDQPRSSDFVGWIETKSKKSKKWKMQFFVASEGVLSYFERADPRPYRLRGQIVLLDAKVSQLEGNILSIEIGSKERLLRFEDRSDLVQWKSVFERDNGMGDAIIGDWEAVGELQTNTDLKDRDPEPSQQGSTSPSSLNRRRARTASLEDMRPGNLRGVRDAGAKFLKNAADGVGRAKAHANRAAVEGMKRARNATDAGMKSIRTGAGMFIRGVRRTGSSDLSPGVERRRPTPDMFLTSTRNLAAKSEKREPTVQAVVEMNNVYRVVSSAQSTQQYQEEDLL
jgi:PH domain